MDLVHDDTHKRCNAQVTKNRSMYSKVLRIVLLNAKAQHPALKGFRNTTEC